MKDQIAESIVAMDNRDPTIIGRHVGAKPFGKTVEFGKGSIGGFTILRGPARDLSLKITAGPAEILKAYRGRIDGMQLCQYFRHREINASAFI